ncbi:ATP-binding protein [soil metagenome]
MTPFVLACLLLVSGTVYLWLRSREKALELQRQLLELKGREDAFVRKTRHRAEMLHRLVEGINDGLFIVSPDLKVMFVNRGALQFFPPITEPVGRSLIECVQDHRIVELVGHSVKSKQRVTEDIQITSAHDDGTVDEQVFSVEVVPLQGDELNATENALLVILRDDTEKHTLEKIRRDFVANASHELRTPMSIINGYLENLLEGDIDDEASIKRAFTIMKKHGDRLARIVEDLLVISRMESGQADALREEEFDFKACAQDVVQRLSPVIGLNEAHVSVVIHGGESPVVRGDRFYWDQILFNLVSNALKENQAKGLQVIISLKQEPDISEIRVSDNGVGIPHADLPYIFKRFYRVTRQRAHDVKGTGLGLSIVKRAVEAHRGKIAVQSVSGIETVFVIRVPRKGAH